MKAQKHSSKIVSFRCVLRNKLGKEISSSFNRGVLTDARSTETEPNSLIRTLLKNLHGMKKGEKKEFFLPASEAYGLYDSSRLMTVSRKSLWPSDHLSVGSQVVRESEDGQPQFFRIVDLTGNQVTLDANHPLAGEDLFFEVELTESRRARPDELEPSQDAGPSGPYLH